MIPRVITPDYIDPGAPRPRGDDPRENVALYAHSIKGALGNVGADQAATVAKNLECAGKDSKLGEAPALHAQLVAAIHEYRKAIRAAGISLGAGSS